MIIAVGANGASVIVAALQAKAVQPVVLERLKLPVVVGGYATMLAVPTVIGIRLEHALTAAIYATLVEERKNVVTAGTMFVQLVFPAQEYVNQLVVRLIIRKAKEDVQKSSRTVQLKGATVY